ncbi:MAG: DUF72 domain-containing protein, partial [Bacteroidia bacterium]|nr:DUF72 domain-containing protein [Bacteroidia bacterium]
MKFGQVKLSDLDRISPNLPPDHPQTAEVLVKSPANETLRAYLGCPVWVNKNWVGTTYPAGTKDKDYFKIYAHQFNGIELNSTHYHIPDLATLKRWREQAMPRFRFSPKFLQEISHQLLPEGRAREATQRFCHTIQQLEDK